MLTPANWATVPLAWASSLRARPLPLLRMAAPFVALLVSRKLLVAAMQAWARPLGQRNDSFHITLLTCAATALLALVWPLPNASGDSELIDGLGRLSFLLGSLALGLFLYRVLRHNRGVLTGTRARQGRATRMPVLWSRVPIAVRLLLAAPASVGYYATALELQARLFTSGWILLAEAQAARTNDSSDSPEALVLQKEEGEIDPVTVSQQTRSLLRTASSVLLAVLLVGMWRGMIPALDVFNDVVLWPSVVTGSDGDRVAAAVTLGHVLMSLLTQGLTAIAARTLPKLVEVMLLQRSGIDSGTLYAVATIGRYAILAVSRIKIRTITITITITNFDNFEVLVPNKAFINETVQNWTLSNKVTRLRPKVRIAYGSDVRQAQQLMPHVATANPEVLKSPAPGVLLLGLSDSAMDFEMRAYVALIDDRLSTTHALYTAMVAALSDAAIDIPFPQRDIHVRHIHPANGAPTPASTPQSL